MNPVTVVLPTVLRAMADGQGAVVVAGGSARECVADLGRRFPGLAEVILPQERPADFVRLFADGSEVTSLAGLDEPVHAELRVLVAVAGG